MFSYQPCDSWVCNPSKWAGLRYLHFICVSIINSTVLPAIGALLVKVWRHTHVWTAHNSPFPTDPHVVFLPPIYDNCILSSSHCASKLSAWESTGVCVCVYVRQRERQWTEWTELCKNEYYSIFNQLFRFFTSQYDKALLKEQTAQLPKYHNHLKH